MSAKSSSANSDHKSSAEILDEIFRELKEKSAKGELPSPSDISAVLGNTLANEGEEEHHKNVLKKKKKKGKHKHSHKHKKHKKKLHHSSGSSIEEWIPAEILKSTDKLMDLKSKIKTELENITDSQLSDTQYKSVVDKHATSATEHCNAHAPDTSKLSDSEVISTSKSSSIVLNVATELSSASEVRSLISCSQHEKLGVEELGVRSAGHNLELPAKRCVLTQDGGKSRKRLKRANDSGLMNSAMLTKNENRAEGPAVCSDTYKGENVENAGEDRKTEHEVGLKSQVNWKKVKNGVQRSKSSKSAAKNLKHRKSTSRLEGTAACSPAKRKTHKNKKHPSSKSKKVAAVSRSRSRSRHSLSPSMTKRKSRSRSRSRISRSKSNSPHLAPLLREKSHSGSRSRRSRSRSRTRRRKGRSNSRNSNSQDRRTSSPSRRNRTRRRSNSRTRSSHAMILGEKIDKVKLLEIARKNAMAMMAEGKLAVPLTLDKPEPEKIPVKTIGKSVEELTDFCKLLSKKEKEEGECSDDDGGKRNHSSDEDDEKGAPFVHHPFKLRDHQPNIIMNIRNAVQIPIKTPAEKAADSVKLRIQFPVSSGTQHRKKEWVPVSPKKDVVVEQVKAKVEEPVIPEPEPAEASLKAPSVDIGAIVSQRLKAVRKLMENPHDVEALGQMYNSQQQMQYWAQSKQLPGQYTGTTDVQLLTPEELAGPAHLQAWVKKDQFNRAAPVQGGFGMYMLQKMGWKPGEGLGKNKEGTAEPLILDIKTDKKGLLSQGEIARRCGAPVAKDLSGKHPVSALVELCNKRHWLPPEFILVHDSGPDHKKNFVFKVRINGQEYQPTIASPNKKHAKAQAATVCLQTLGLVPRDLNNPL